MSHLRTNKPTNDIDQSINQSINQSNNCATEEVTGLVAYARARGVRVVVEFDVPGHAASWCAGRPEVCPSETCLEPLNVASNATFDLIGTILDEAVGGSSSSSSSSRGSSDAAAPLFPDEMVHLGGDEVDTACWDSTPAVADWMAANGMTADDAYAYFVGRAAQMAIARGKRPIQWSEVVSHAVMQSDSFCLLLFVCLFVRLFVCRPRSLAESQPTLTLRRPPFNEPKIKYDHFKTDLAPETVVHIWKAVTNVTEVVANGYDVLVNVGYVPRSWYLDNTDVGWKQCYAKDPCGEVLRSADPGLCAKRVLGGHGEVREFTQTNKQK